MKTKVTTSHMPQNRKDGSLSYTMYFQM